MKSTRELAQIWWDELNGNQREDYLVKYECLNNDFSFNTTVHNIYKAEHPQPLKEVTPSPVCIEGGYKKWEVDSEFATRVRTSQFTYVEQTIEMDKCHSIHDYDAFTKFGGAEETAKRIVKAVNGWDELHNFISRISSIKVPNGMVNGDKINLIVDEAKAILNNINNQ